MQPVVAIHARNPVYPQWFVQPSPLQPGFAYYPAGFAPGGGAGLIPGQIPSLQPQPHPHPQQPQQPQPQPPSVAAGDVVPVSDAADGVGTEADAMENGATDDRNPTAESAENDADGNFAGAPEKLAAVDELDDSVSVESA